MLSIVFLYQSKWQGFGYPLWVVPDRIWVSSKFTNLIGVCYSWIAVERRYFPWGASLMFDRNFLLMKAFHFDWLSRRRQFSSIPASYAEARMVSPTLIILVFPLLRESTYWTLSIMGSICKNYCDEVWENMSPGDRVSYHSSVGIPIMRLHDASSTFTNVFFLLLHQESCYQIFPVLYSWMVIHPPWAFCVQHSLFPV